MSFKDVWEWIQNAAEQQFFVISNTPITLGSIITFFFIFVVFVVLAKMMRRWAGTLLFRTSLDPGMQYAFIRTCYYLMLVAGAIVGLQSIGFDFTGLLVVFGFLSVGIGFGLQNITSNFVSGLILLFERPIKIGDRVTIADIEGDVEEINFRSTTIRSLNNISIIVPNSEFISGTVVNWSHVDQKVRLEVLVGVSYSSDLDAVIRSLNEVAAENKSVMSVPKPDVVFLGFGDSSWEMSLRVWIEDPKQYPRIRSEVNCEIVRKFRKNGVEIPFPQRDLHVRSPLPIPLSEIRSNNGSEEGQP